MSRSSKEKLAVRPTPWLALALRVSGRINLALGRACVVSSSPTLPPSFDKPLPSQCPALPLATPPPPHREAPHQPPPRKRIASGPTCLRRAGLSDCGSGGCGCPPPPPRGRATPIAPQPPQRNPRLALVLLLATSPCRRGADARAARARGVGAGSAAWGRGAAHPPRPVGRKWRGGWKGGWKGGGECEGSGGGRRSSCGMWWQCHLTHFAWWGWCARSVRSGGCRPLAAPLMSASRREGGGRGGGERVHSDRLGG